MRIQLFKILMLMSMLLLAACGQAATASPTPAPTTDLNPVRTEVAATVLAQVPQICALTPTATQVPTNTPQPTATQQATATTASTPLTGAATTGTPSADQAKWVAQTVADGTKFAPGEAFTMTWRLQNVGTTTWTTNYRLRHFSGDRYGAPEFIPLAADVAPGQTVDITVPMKAPSKTGSYRSDWVMSNTSLYNFNQPVYLEISVAVPATSTATATTAATAAPTATATTAPTAAPTNTPEPPTPTATNTATN